MKDKFQTKITEIGAIPEDWQESIFSDVIDVNPSRELKKETETVSVSMKDLQEFNKKIQGYIRRKFKGGAKFINGDTLMARITPCLENGKTAFVDILPDAMVGFGSTEFNVLSAKKGKSIPHFVYYLCVSPDVRKAAIKSMTGTSGRQRVEGTIFDQIIIHLPSIREQEAIAGFLNALDEKIELNRQMNATLEKIAQSLFKHWFIDFEFPDEKGKTYKSSGGEMANSEAGEIPKGWGVGKFSEVIAVNPRRRLIKRAVAKKVSMADLERWQSWINSWSEEPYNSGSVFQNGDTLLARITPCLEQGKTAFVSFLNEGESAFGSTEFIVLAPQKIDSPSYIFFLATSESLREEAINSMSGTSGRQRVPTDFFDHFMVPVPPEPIIQKFDFIAKAVMIAIGKNSKEISILTAIRDSLLPKFMKGQIRINTNKTLK